jgi:hypothetical protein
MNPHCGRSDANVRLQARIVETRVLSLPDLFDGPGEQGCPKRSCGRTIWVFSKKDNQEAVAKIMRVRTCSQIQAIDEAAE